MAAPIRQSIVLQVNHRRKPSTDENQAPTKTMAKLDHAEQPNHDSLETLWSEIAGSGLTVDQVHRRAGHIRADDTQYVGLGDTGPCAARYGGSVRRRLACCCAIQ